MNCQRYLFSESFQTVSGFLGMVSNAARRFFSANGAHTSDPLLVCPSNRYLASLIADVAEMEFRDTMAFFTELGNDVDLKRHIARRSINFAPEWEVRFGRCIGWYAFVRTLKPETTVEIQSGDGLGACLVTAALRRNAAEGFLGRYHGIDPIPGSGHLLSGAYADFGDFLYGSTLTSISNINAPIDLLIINSDYSSYKETALYEMVVDRFSDQAVVLSTHSSYSDALFDFSLRDSRRFILYHEKVEGGWYHSVGMGISYKKRDGYPPMSRNWKSVDMQRNTFERKTESKYSPKGDDLKT